MTRRIALASLLVVTLVVGLVGFAIYERFSRELLQQDDAQLALLASRPLSLLVRPTSSELAVLRAADGTPQLTTPELAAIGALPVTSPGYSTVQVAHHSLRVYTLRLPGGRVLAVASERTSSTAALRRLRRLLAFGGIAAGLLTALALAFVTRRALVPLHRVTEVAETITRTGGLGHRVPSVEGSDEPALLARAINAMLDRLNASDDALRRMIADASHELRTPLTTLRGNLDLLGATPALSASDRADALRDAAAEVRQMQVLIDDMLDLARSETAAPRTAVALSALVPGAPAGLAVRGDEASLARMLRNLELNASRYGGGAQIAVTSDVRAVAIRVVDHGPGVPEDERERVFERFARGRGHQSTPGSGLGLAIARTIARNHGGDIRIESTPGGGATFVVTLPRERGQGDEPATV